MRILLWNGVAAVLLALLVTFCDKGPQSVKLKSLLLEVSADSTISVRDTLHVKTTVEEAYNDEARICWRRGGALTPDTTDKTTFSIVWQFPDTGLQHIVVWAIDSLERESDKVTITVQVKWYRPEVTIGGDSTVAVNDEAVVRAKGKDRDGTIDYYEWEIDKGGIRTTDADEDSLTAALYGYRY